ncbi:MAG TPA: ABC transporter ATP-binding protein [Flavobacteriales bacterium]|nr:ABC transporter ATP-binding protein [Flavobacteriales bacterium]
MKVALERVGKHFGREVVFQGVDITLEPGSRTAILGPNGSGKSTLLQVIGGAIIPTVGQVAHSVGGKPIEQEEVYRHVSIAAPYLGLYEDLSLEQAIGFHARFKPLLSGITIAELARLVYLEHALQKTVQHFSSGMKQRLKLALAILSDTPLLLLDEPTSNLDAEAIAWFRKLLADNLAHRTLVIASNHIVVEHELCTDRIDLRQFKP